MKFHLKIQLHLFFLLTSNWGLKSTIFEVPLVLVYITKQTNGESKLKLTLHTHFDITILHFSENLKKGSMFFLLFGCLYKGL